MNTSSKYLSGPYIRPASGTAKQLVVLMHGWGADGPNLADLGYYMSPHLPDAHFISPTAPFPCEAGFGYQWFSLQTRSPAVMAEGAAKAAQIVNGFVDEQLDALSLSADKLAFVGFSQGTMTSLYVALRRATACSAVVGFSGALVGEAELPDQLRSKPPICLIHGEQDEVVPFMAMPHAAQVLKKHGVSVETHARPLIGHSIDEAGLQIAVKFLKEKLGY